MSAHRSHMKFKIMLVYTFFPILTWINSLLKVLQLYLVIQICNCNSSASYNSVQIMANHEHFNIRKTNSAVPFLYHGFTHTQNNIQLTIFWIIVHILSIYAFLKCILLIWVLCQVHFSNRDKSLVILSSILIQKQTHSFCH